MTRLRARVVEAQPITILSYHAVSPDGHRFAITPKTFARHISLITQRYVVARLAEIDSLFANAVERTVILTFDDAYRDFLTHAYPILAAAGIPSTVFVPTRFVGGFNEWDVRTGRAPRRDILTGDELRELHRDGLVDIGSHTVDHVRLTSLAVDDLRHQVRDSKLDLEDMLGVPITMFAYPYGMPGDFSDRTEQALDDAGYEIAVTSHWGTLNSRRSRLRLRRITLTGDQESAIRRDIEGVHDWIGSKETLAYGLRRFGLRQPN